MVINNRSIELLIATLMGPVRDGLGQQYWMPLLDTHMMMGILTPPLTLRALSLHGPPLPLQHPTPLDQSGTAAGSCQARPRHRPFVCGASQVENGHYRAHFREPSPFEGD